MILVSAALFGSYGIWSKAMGKDFGIFFQGWTRSAIVLLLLLPVVVYKKAYRFDREDLRWVVVSVVFGALTQAPLYYAFNHATIGTVLVIFYALFVITAYLVGRLFLGERITKIKLMSMFLAFAGLALTFGLSLEKFSFLALGMAALNGVASGGEVSTTKRTTSKYSSLMITFYIWLGIFITHLPLSLVTHEKQWPLAWDKDWGAMLAFALAGLVAFWLVIEGFKFVDASIGSLLGLTEVIFGMIYGAIIFNEGITLTVASGAALIILAAMLPDLMNIIQNKRIRISTEPMREM